jgi:hemoglobin
MRRHHWLAFLCLAAFLILLAGSGQAQDSRAAPLDRKTIDTMVFNSLRDVINRGADLYNSGDWAGCYRLYEGALMATRPLLEHRPDLQTAIRDGLRAAESDSVLYNRAFVLRRVIDKVRVDVNPNPKSAVKPEDKGEKKEKKEMKAAVTLWDRLGGEKGVGSIIDDVIKAAGSDPKVDFSRGGQWKPTPADVELLRKHLIQQVSELTGGPLRYEGLDMRESHKGMGITNAQYDAFLDDVDKVLRDHNVSRDDMLTIREKMEKYRTDIVAPPKKPDGKKSDEVKSDQAPAVSGKVTHNGKPLTDGTVQLRGPDGKGYSAKVKADGTYELKGIKAGEYKVTVEGTDVPKKYSDVKTTPLAVTVSDKAGTYNLDLTD